MASLAFEGLSDANQAIIAGTQRTFSLDSEDSEHKFNTCGGPEDPLRPTWVSRDNLRVVLADRQVHAIRQLYQLPWFTRVWVLQEVGLATVATACLDDFRMDFTEIALFVWFAMNDHNLEERLGAETRGVIAGCPYNAVWSVWSTYNKRNS